MLRLCVYRDIEHLGSLESTQEARVPLCCTSSNSYASFVLSKLPKCSVSWHTHADEWTNCKMFSLNECKKMPKNKFQKPANLFPLYDPRMVQYPTNTMRSWFGASNQIHLPSTGSTQSTIHYQSYRTLQEKQGEKLRVVYLKSRSIVYRWMA